MPSTFTSAIFHFCEPTAFLPFFFSFLNFFPSFSLTAYEMTSFHRTARLPGLFAEHFGLHGVHLKNLSAVSMYSREFLSFVFFFFINAIHKLNSVNHKHIIIWTWEKLTCASFQLSYSVSKEFHYISNRLGFA